MLTYEEIFSHRGYTYNQAMSEYPDVREHEFKQLVNKFQYHPGITVSDIPSGGEYMRNYLPECCQYVGFEPCDNFKLNTQGKTNLFPLPIKDASIDLTLSLAGLHHIEDKVELFRDFLRISKRDAYLGVSDIYQYSMVSSFMDEFVGKHNTTGHQGLYLSEQTLEQLNQSGWQVLSAERVPFQWIFKDELHMALFCRRLFDLSCHNDRIIDEINNRLGIDRLPGNLIGMNWELYTITAKMS